jgi:hypothetical protein
MKAEDEKILPILPLRSTLHRRSGAACRRGEGCYSGPAPGADGYSSKARKRVAASTSS